LAIASQPDHRSDHLASYGNGINGSGVVIMAELTLFFDGGCPLCAAEINQLRKRDRHQKIAFEDIFALDFKERFPYIDQVEADKVLHGELSDGRLIFGLDVTCLAWTLVGKSRWVRLLRWPVVKSISDVLYTFFARHRHRISRLIMGRRRCDGCAVTGQKK
jgi:predicted DCC family thiol-disulfide oxidoreductase YuxK